MITLKTNSKLVSIDSVKTAEIGQIDSNTLIITDPLYHEQSRSLGIDKELFLEKFKYNIILIKFLEKKYFTTRLFFMNHKRWYKNFSRRDAFYLQIKDFGLKRAKLYEDYIKRLATSQQDLFEVLAKDDSKSREELFKSYEAVEEYDNFIKERKIIL